MLPPNRFVAGLARRYSTAWRRFDEARAGRSPSEPAVPTWLTFAECASALQQIADDTRVNPPPEELFDLYVGSTWRVTQGVYRFDSDLCRALANTPLDISLPASLLSRLPEWGVYVETPGMENDGRAIAGMLATLACMPTGASLCLLFLPAGVSSYGADVDRLQFRLTDEPLRDQVLAELNKGVDPQLRESVNELGRFGVASDESTAFMLRVRDTARVNALDHILAQIVPFISLLLYLCSEEPEIDGRPQTPVGKVTKRGVRFFAPDRPLTWNVGMRTGAALRAARSDYDEASSGGRGGVRPHYRKAHWHSYWHGPRAGNRALKLRWIMPTAVNVKPQTALPAVVHAVSGETQ